MVRDADIRGAMILQAPSGILARIHSDMLSGLTDGSLKPVVRSIFDLEKAQAAAELQALPGACGKVVLACVPPSA
jgi:NADPH:quinone reductase-like Zn-dependent oxidoreductase